MKRITELIRLDLINNVLILYFDNLSRAHFFRKLPKTAEWISKFVDNQQSQYSTFQYFRYHSAYYNTLYSNDGMYLGEVGPLNDTTQNVFDSYSQNGYITGFFKDSWEAHSYSIKAENPTLHRWDHMGGGVTWDKNFDNDDFTSLTIFRGKSSSARRWLYGKNIHETQIDYLKQFWAAYPENRKLFRTHFSESHELMGELVKYIDQDITDLLQFFYDRGYLEDTLITIVSDHGAHALTLRFPAFPDNSRYVENYYPVLFHIVKNDIPDENLKFMRSNEQSFISSFDFYATMKSIAENKRSTSAYVASYPYHMEQIPEANDCSDSKVFIADCWCSNDIDSLNKKISSRGIFYTKV